MTTLDCDILHPTSEEESQTCKKMKLIPNPDSEYLSLRCAACMSLTTAFSNSTIPVTCSECNAPLAYPTGGKIRLAEGVEQRTRI